MKNTIFVLLIGLTFSACSTTTENEQMLGPRLKVESVNPRQVNTDQAVTLIGLGFDTTVTVFLDGRPITIDKATPSEIQFTAPTLPGDYSVTVRTASDSIVAGELKVNAEPNAIVTLPDGLYQITSVSIETPSKIDVLFKPRFEEVYYPSVGAQLKANMSPVYYEATMANGTISAEQSDHIASIAFRATQNAIAGSLENVTISVTNKPPIMPGSDVESLSFSAARMLISLDSVGQYVAEASGNFSFDQFGYSHVWDHPVGPSGGSGSTYANSTASHPTSKVRIVFRLR